MDSHWTDLLNSDWHDHLGHKSEDRLDNNEWLKDFLGRWQWSSSTISFDEARRPLRKLRTVMARMVKSTVAGNSVSAGDLDSLNKFLGSAPLVQQMEREKGDYRLAWLPLEKNLETILAEIAFSFTQVFVEGDPTRIRICENEDCRWVFYDQSKNRTRCWCDASSCGNLMKVRRFRERKKQESRAK